MKIYLRHLGLTAQGETPDGLRLVPAGSVKFENSCRMTLVPDEGETVKTQQIHMELGEALAGVFTAWCEKHHYTVSGTSRQCSSNE